MAAIHIPRMMRVGAQVSRQVPEALMSLGCSRPLIVTDSFVSRSGMLVPMQAALSASSMHAVTFDGVVPDPTTHSLKKGVDLAASCDAVVGFGGGSSIDSAKAIAVLARHGGPLARFKVPAEAPSGLPVIAIPTTAGTGSEVTRVAVITNSETDEKMLCAGPGLLPDVALVDFELSMAKPYRLTADSGLDALCHAMEAYVSRKASPFTDTMALAALKAIVTHLPRCCLDPNDREAREAMMLAATQAGIAFSNASVTLIHGMSRPIGARFHVPHGLSNAILLPQITAYSLAGTHSRYAECARAMGFAHDFHDDATACARLVDGLTRLTAELGVPKLSELGIARSDFLKAAPLMAEQALASGSPANNPVVPSAEMMVGLYKEVYA